MIMCGCLVTDFQLHVMCSYTISNRANTIRLYTYNGLKQPGCEMFGTVSSRRDTFTVDTWYIVVR